MSHQRNENNFYQLTNYLNKKCFFEKDWFKTLVTGCMVALFAQETHMNYESLEKYDTTCTEIYVSQLC